MSRTEDLLRPIAEALEQKDVEIARFRALLRQSNFEREALVKERDVLIHASSSERKELKSKIDEIELRNSMQLNTIKALQNNLDAMVNVGARHDYTISLTIYTKGKAEARHVVAAFRSPEDAKALEEVVEAWNTATIGCGKMEDSAVYKGWLGDMIGAASGIQQSVALNTPFVENFSNSPPNDPEERAMVEAEQAFEPASPHPAPAILTFVKDGVQHFVRTDEAGAKAFSDIYTRWVEINEVMKRG